MIARIFDVLASVETGDLLHAERELLRLTTEIEDRQASRTTIMYYHFANGKFLSLDKLDEAFIAINECVATADVEGNVELASLARYVLAELHYRSKAYEQSLKQLAEAEGALELRKPASGGIILTMIHALKTVCHLKQGAMDEAEQSFERNKQFLTDFPFPRPRVISKINMGHLLMEQGALRRAENVYDDALYTAREIDLADDVLRCYAGLGLTVLNLIQGGSAKVDILMRKLRISCVEAYEYAAKRGYRLAELRFKVAAAAAYTLNIDLDKAKTLLDELTSMDHTGKMKSDVTTQARRVGSMIAEMQDAFDFSSYMDTKVVRDGQKESEQLLGVVLADAWEGLSSL